MTRQLTPAEKAELGAQRCRWRRRIQESMDRYGIRSARSLARELGVAPNTVYRTLSGELHTPRVLDALREMGCPERYLFDPRRVGAGDGEAA